MLASFSPFLIIFFFKSVFVGVSFRITNAHHLHSPLFCYAGAKPSPANGNYIVILLVIQYVLLHLARLLMHLSLCSKIGSKQCRRPSFLKISFKELFTPRLILYESIAQHIYVCLLAIIMP